MWGGSGPGLVSLSGVRAKDRRVGYQGLPVQEVRRAPEKALRAVQTAIHDVGDGGSGLEVAPQR